jgi:hypothetical protein
MQTKTKVGVDGCRHNWIMRDKKTFQIVKRVCGDCGQEELHGEGKNMTDKILAELMKEGA